MAEEKKPEVKEERVEEGAVGEDEVEVGGSDSGHPGSSEGRSPVERAGMSTAGWDSITSSFT